MSPATFWRAMAYGVFGLVLLFVGQYGVWALCGAAVAIQVGHRIIKGEWIDFD